jgi:hypothetical protein
VAGGWEVEEPWGDATLVSHVVGDGAGELSGVAVTQRKPSQRLQGLCRGRARRARGGFDGWSAEMSVFAVR